VITWFQGTKGNNAGYSFFVIKCECMKKKAFTLLELIVVIAIIGIMSVSALIMISPSQRATQDLQAEGHKVTSVIATLQSNALSGKNAGSGCLYQFNATVGAATYTMVGCVAGSYNTTAGVTFKNGASFSFSSPFGAPSFGASQPITLTKGGQDYSLCVYSNGRIVENVTLVGGTTCP